MVFLKLLSACQLMLCFLKCAILAQSEIKLSNNSNEKEAKIDPCIVEKDGYIYDLTSLSSRPFWHYSETAHNNSNLEFFLSLCNPIEGLESRPLCNSSNEGVCFMFRSNEEGQENLDLLISAGKIDLNNNVPVITQEGSLMFLYQNGSSCKIGNTDIRYRTELHLQCPHNADTETFGPILMISPKCVFIFVWMTFAACPKTVEYHVNDSSSCIIKYSNYEDELNLHSLANRTFYQPQTASQSFEINICSGIRNGSCQNSENVSVCNTTDPQNPVALAYSDAYSFKWKDNFLLMVFKNTKNDTRVEVSLYCDRTAIVPKVYNILSKSELVTFKILSINVCTPGPIDCVIEDKHFNVYDLRSLHLPKKNYKIIGKNYKSLHSMYHLNICGPLNPSFANDPHKCPEGFIGACQTSISSAAAKNLGYITSVPVVNQDQSITVMYTGGDPCKAGAKSSSTRITLICSRTQFSPILISISESCEHVFEWHHPAACAVSVVSGEDCQVTDPLYGHTYDLNPLRNSTHDYLTKDMQNEYRLNLCGPLVSKCSDDLGSDASVCKLGSEPESGGTTPGELIFNDGTIVITFSNGSLGCGDKRWSSQILLLCDHSTEQLGPSYIHSDNEGCIHHFIWFTTHACPPHRVNDACSVRDGDFLYDLMPLSDSLNNQVFISYDGAKKYVLNVCRSIIHSKASRCPYDSGSCLIDLSRKNSGKNLGSVSSMGPYLEDGSLKLKYENGDICNSTNNYTTIINFECSTNVYDAFPILEAEEQCLSVFKWSTSHACPLFLPPSDKKGGNCTVVNPQTKYLFDMNDLRNDAPYDLNILDGVHLLVNVCGKIVDERCSEDNSGACLVYSNGLSKSGGNYNNDLKFHMWSTYLEYEGGTACSNGYSRSTRISFICPTKQSHNGPVFIDDDQNSCTFFINWYTDNACERHINCYAHSYDRMFDLSPLVKTLGNYAVQDPRDATVTYLLNVCGPLNPVIGVNCHPGSSSCSVQKHRQPLSLGHPLVNPVVDNDARVLLMYSHGSKCPQNTHIFLSSKIIFTCNISAGAGEPTFYNKTKDCQTQFLWPTSLVCPPILTEGGHCQIAYKKAKANVDLSPLMQKGPYKASYEEKNFLINVCGESVCKNSGVCNEDTGESYGLSTRSELHWDYNELVLTFYGGDSCDHSLNGHRSTEIYFQCDPEAGYGSPKPSHSMNSLSCMAVFNWSTNITCMEAFYRPVVQPASPNNNQSSKVAPLQDDDYSRTWILSVLITTSVMVSVVVVVMYLLGRSPYGRRLYLRAKRSMTRTGDQAYILDDHHLSL